MPFCLNPTTFLLITLAFLLVSPCLSSNPKEILVAHYDDGSQMNRQMIGDYLVSEECVVRCPRYNKESLLKSFDAFRLIWVQRMINFVIKELQIDSETSKEILKNPSTYMINYDKFKLLAFK